MGGACVGARGCQVKEPLLAKELTSFPELLEKRISSLREHVFDFDVWTRCLLCLELSAALSAISRNPSSCRIGRRDRFPAPLPARL
eukprot:3113024-Amphidinium_carterae.1